MGASRYRAGPPAPAAFAVALALVGLAAPAVSRAAIFTVDNTDDAGDGSLRQAILDANASPAPSDSIVFTLPADSTITLGSDLPTLAGDVELDATGAPGLLIDGDGNTILDTNGSNVDWIDVNAESGDVELGNDDTVTFTANQDFEVAADIGDAGAATSDSLVKEGDAALTLSGNNTFTGTVALNDGTLIGDTDSLPTDIVNDAALVFDQANSGTYAGVISGTGSLEKEGNGNLTLSGANTYSGGTTVSDGTLTGNTTSLQGDITNDATLVFDQAVDGTFAGNISGTGSVTKEGAGNLTLGGDNSYEGGTTVDAGTLTGSSASIPGNVDLAAGTTLVVDQDADGSLGGAISGMGALVKQGTGAVRLGGANSYEGGTSVDAGTLIVDTGSLPATGGTQVAAGATLSFDQGADGAFTGTISGAGDLTKTGSGTLTFSALQPYTGTTTVSGGTLELDGAGEVVGATTVESGGTLAGNGTVSAPVTVDGTLSPGGATQDTFQITGTAGFGAGSQLVVDVGPSDVGDQLAVTGNVDIDPDATLEIRPAPGDYSVATTVDVVDAGSVTGSFDLGEDFAFLDRTVSYPGGGIVRVMLVENGANLANVGQTENQRAVGTALSTLTGSSDPDVQELFDNLNTLTVSEAAPALDALSGEALAAFTTSRAVLGERTQRVVQRRMRSLLFASEEAWPAHPKPATPRRSSAPTGSLSASDVAAPPRLGERGVGVWFDGWGILGELDGDGNSADLDYTLYGSNLGVDFRLGDQVLVGGAAGYARTDLDVDDRDSDGDADTAQGMLYAAWANRRVYAGLSGRYAWTQSETSRDIAVGTLYRKARGDFDANDYGVRGEVAVNAFETESFGIEPQVGLEWNHLSRESFTESGAGGLGLRVDSEDLDSTLLQLGGRIHGLFGVDEDSVLAPEIRAYWLHEFGDDERRVDAHLDGAPFTVVGAEAPRDSALVGVGWAMSLGRSVRATAGYDLRIDEDRMEHTGAVTVRVRF
ncbi:MAG: autotransporter outer membrane beta-barrel domain-containing protein [Myxococcota bacterium]